MPTTIKPSGPRHTIISKLAKAAAKRLGTNYRLGKLFGVAHSKYANLANGIGVTRLEALQLKTLLELTHANGFQLVPVAVTDDAIDTKAKEKILIQLQVDIMEIYEGFKPVPTKTNA